MHETPVQSLKAKTIVLLVPGIGNSGPAHWQSYWEAQNDSFVRVQQHDWDHPVCSEWMSALETAVRSVGEESVIVAHSLGCLLVTHWLSRTTLRVKGVMLVAVPNPSGPNFPTEAAGFDPVPMQRISCPSIIVASTDDPYGDPAFTQRCAVAWGSRLVSIGKAGHINAASGLEEWPQGQRLLRELTHFRVDRGS